METNSSLKAQAQQLLGAYQAVIGDAVVTGSYALDLMVCPDLDVYLLRDRVENLFRLAESIYECRLTEELYIQKGVTLGIPEGEHVQVRTSLRAERAKWKIDIWVFPRHLIEARRAEIAYLKGRLSDADRMEIIALKNALLQPNGFTPKFSGIYIYRAYLEAGIRDLAGMKEHLRGQGLTI